MLGIDGTAWTAIAAIVAAGLAGGCSVWAARSRNQIDAKSSAMDSAIKLINELQQEREAIREALGDDIKRCNIRVNHLEGRMSMLVTYVRQIESFLRSKHLFDKAPKFDWQAFYSKVPNGNGA